ncbi:MAG: ABC transporter permease [Ethanoligenens sp.]
MILNKRIKRIFCKNIVSYLAIFVLIIMSSFLVVAFGGTTYTAGNSVKTNWDRNSVEDGEFTTYVPLSETNLAKLRNDSIKVEKQYYVDIGADGGTTVRIFKNRDEINKVQLKKGKLGLDKDDIVLEYTFANAYGYTLGDKITIGATTYRITGTCAAADYAHRVQNISDVGTDKSFGIGFVNDEAFDNLIQSSQYKDNVVYNYAYINKGTLSGKEIKDELADFQCDKNDITDTYIKDKLAEMDTTRANIEEGFKNIENASSVYNKELSDSVAALSDGVERYMGTTMDYKVPILKTFIERDRNSRITGIIQYNESMLSYAIIAGILLSTIIAYVLSVFALNNIKKDSVAIGTLYALGFSKRELILHYMILSLIIVLVGAVSGTILGIHGVTWFMAINYSYPNLSPSVSPVLLVYGVAMPILLTVLINYAVLNKKLNVPPLEMLHPEKVVDRVMAQTVSGKKFKSVFRKTQFLREKRSYLILFFGAGIAIIFMMLGFALHSTIKNYSDNVGNDINYKYMYELEDPLEQKPGNTETAYTKSFTIYCKQAGMDMDVVLQGVNPQSRYFDFASKMKNDDSLIYISNSAVVKYGYKVGDKVTFTDYLNDRDYTFTVAGIVNYENGIYFFMNINAMRDYFGVDNSYYNTLFSNEKISIPDAMLMNMITRDTIKETAKSWMDAANSYLYLFLAVGILTFIITMYLLVKTIIEHASSNISLMKIFGYGNREVKQMYLGNLKYVVIFDIVVFIPFSAFIMRSLIPMLNATMGSGMVTYISPVYYVLMIAIILSVFTLVYSLLGNRMNKISFAEILKNRE